MITKNKVKNISYADRDSKPNEVVTQLFEKSKDECVLFLEHEIEKMQDKDAGTYRTVELEMKVINKEIENMRAFFMGAVAPYYCRQMKEFWGDKIPKELLEDCVKEIKRKVGFILYGWDGHPTNEVNSITNFRESKEFAEFITNVENVCFADNGLLFPNSDHFNELVETKGRSIAERQSLNELKAWHKNQFNQNV